MNILKDKFSTSIKLKRIKHYKTHGTLEERRVRHSLVPILPALP
jgi:hypothetical protein